MALTELLTGNAVRNGLDETACDAITEVGNVLLNACLGAFSNLMRMNIKFTVPELRIDQIQGVFQSMRIGGEGMKCAMMVRTRFDVRGSNVTGFIVFLMGVTYLEDLIDGLERWSSQ